MEHEKAISIIESYERRYLFEPANNWPKYWFKQRSYCRWAAEELIDYIRNNPSTPVIILVEKFINRMDLYSTKNQKNSWIFAIARDEAQNIYDILFL